jgi:LPS sulfotransferase NodH
MHVKLTASVKRPVRLLWFALRNQFYRVFGYADYKKFIIITRSRTGSNLLVSLLDSHPQTEAFGEMFNLLHGRKSEWVWESIFGYKSRSTKLVGFKIFYYHPADSDDTWVWDRVINDKNIPIIHLKRDNVLRTYLSRQIAAKTKVWHDKSGKSAVDLTDKRVTLSPSDCIEEFKKTEDWVSTTAKKLEGHKTLNITYSDLTGDNQKQTLNSIQSFLGVKPISLSSGMKKQNTERLQDLIKNYKEIENSLQGTPWERFLK